MNANLDKVLNLVKKTNDRVVVVPVPSTRDDEPYVVVPFNQYENILKDEVDYKSMTEEEMLNRINKEMSLWKQSQRELGFDPDMDFLKSVDDKEDEEYEEEVAEIKGEGWLDEEEPIRSKNDEEIWTAPEEVDEEDEKDLIDLELEKEDFDEYAQKMKDLDEKEPGYEKISPPPNLPRKEELPVIDMSFKESYDVLADIKNNEEEDNDFLVEPIE